MKTVIGIVGEKGSGKGTFTKFLNDFLPGKVSIVKSSDILGETLELWDIPKTRSNLQQLAIIMDDTYGVGTLTHAVEERISKSKNTIVAYELDNLGYIMSSICSTNVVYMLD